MLARMGAFAGSWIQQAEALGLASELIVVEWNPVPGCRSLADAIPWPKKHEHCRIRFITVPPERHALFPHPESIPLHQMIAKNVGLRRADGEFVLATNLDIVFSAELMQFLASRRLNRAEMYRIDRYDVDRNIPAGWSVDGLLEHCAGRLLRVHTREGDFEIDNYGNRKLQAADVVTEGTGILFGKGWYPPESYGGEKFRWMQPFAEVIFRRPGGKLPRLFIDLEAGPSAGGPLRLDAASQDGRTLATATIEGRCRIALAIPAEIESARIYLRVAGGNVPLGTDLRFLNLRVFSLEWAPRMWGREAATWQFEVCGAKRSVDWATTPQAPTPFAHDMTNAAYLHTNGCGDFTLMSRESWFALRGYAEIPIWPMHIDSLLCYSAHHAGIREAILNDPLRIYHIEHPSGAGWTPEGEQERTARVASKKVPALRNEDVVELVTKMRRLNTPIIFNLENWGLCNEALTERKL